jgi:spore coat polysaccharide biosynthesis protein SpsF (cytidylyltransferase family)
MPDSITDAQARVDVTLSWACAVVVERAGQRRLQVKVFVLLCTKLTIAFLLETVHLSSFNGLVLVAVGGEPCEDVMY